MASMMPSKRGMATESLYIGNFYYDLLRLQNYCKEAINLLMQFHFLLPKRLAEQLKWSRCVNTRGVIGGNIPADLHLEHLNHHLKDMLSNLRSNITSIKQ